MLSLIAQILGFLVMAAIVILAVVIVCASLVSGRFLGMFGIFEPLVELLTKFKPSRDAKYAAERALSEADAAETPKGPNA